MDGMDLYRLVKEKRASEWEAYALWAWCRIYQEEIGSRRDFAREKVLLPLVKKYNLEEVISFDS